jgi:signal transduction histidine kinase/ligand-binding sensor domain-containing protein
MRHGAILAVLATFLSVPVPAADLVEETLDYSIESWDEHRGLPSTRIWAITQDADGYLWLATQAGPIRFDGVRFEQWKPTAASEDPEDLGVSALYPAKDGSLWMTFYSGGIGRIRGGHLERYGKAAGIGYGRLVFLLEDAAGTIWAGNADTLYRLPAERPSPDSRAPTPEPRRWESGGGWDGLPRGGAFDAYQDRNGALWIATNEGVFRRAHAQAMFERVDPRASVRRFSEDSLGQMWVTDPVSGFTSLDGSASPPSTGPAGVGHVIMHDRRDTMWLGTRGQGLWRVHDEAQPRPNLITRITVAEGLSSNIVRSVFEDRDGNVWVGTESGLHRFTVRKARPLADIGFSWAVQSTPDGSTWVATGEGLLRFRDAARRRYGIEDGLPGTFVRALFTDAHGTLWVATNRGIARRNGPRFEPVAVGDSLPSTVISLAVDARGQLWVCDRDLGAFSWTNGRMTPADAPPGTSSAIANFVHVDRHDRLWMGFQGTTVAVYDRDASVRTFTLGRGLGSALTALYEDQTGAMWIGGTRGLARIHADTVDILTQPGDLPGYGVFAITEDSDGDIWLGVSSGIVRLQREAFERAARSPQSALTYRFYDSSDGLVGVPARQGFPGAARQAGGTMLFTTSQGASIIDPGHTEPSGAPPLLRIESVTAGDQRVALTDGASLPPGTSRLLVEYTAVNLSSPMKDRFLYRLEGVDADWVDAGTRREAFYSNLRAGTYRFQVRRQSSNDEAALESAATWAFAIRPMYYETWWFLAGCLGLVGVMAWGAWQLRLHQLRRQFALVFAERARMSRELHDTLLQDLVGLTLHFDELAATLGDTHNTAAGQALRLRQYLERAIGEARQAVWDLRSEVPDDQDIPGVLRESGERAFAGRPMQFEMKVTGEPRPCPPAIERHLLRIAREALSNAARHSDATSVTLTLDYRPSDLVLRVADNGRGCQTSDLAGRAPGHYGFLIMKERADQIGGRFEVAAGPERGTTIEVTIPAA